MITTDWDFRHAWISYMVDAPPTADKILQSGHRTWEIPEHRPNLTLSRAAFKTYSTYVQPM
jgi:NADH:ubiquinone oxidoreductase subunit